MDLNVCYSSLATNSTAPAAGLGTYVISSPTNAWSETFQMTASGISFVGYNHLVNYPDFVSFHQQITNGAWSILVTNATSTNVYTFAITTTGFSSNSLPPASAIFGIWRRQRHQQPHFHLAGAVFLEWISRGGGLQ